MQQPGPLVIVSTNVTVGSTSTALVAANRKRMFLQIINRSDERVDVVENATAVAGEGIPLNPVDSDSNIQGAYEWSQGTGNLTQQAVNGICASGSKTVTVREGT